MIRLSQPPPTVRLVNTICWPPWGNDGIAVQSSPACTASRDCFRTLRPSRWPWLCERCPSRRPRSSVSRSHPRGSRRGAHLPIRLGPSARRSRRARRCSSPDPDRTVCRPVRTARSTRRSSLPASQAPVRSTRLASNAFGALSQAAATAGEGLGDGARVGLAEAEALACTLTDGAMLRDGDDDARTPRRSPPCPRPGGSAEYGPSLPSTSAACADDDGRLPRSESLADVRSATGTGGPVSRTGLESCRTRASRPFQAYSDATIAHRVAGRLPPRPEMGSSGLPASGGRAT